MEYGYEEPVYSVGIVTKSLKVCPATLRIWEKKGLIKPARLGKNRFYSKADLERLQRIKNLLREKRVNIEGVRNIFQASRCWELKKCEVKVKAGCPVYLKYANNR